MLYRSPWTRVALIVVALLAGWLLTFGNGAKWRSTPSLHWLAQAPIPLQAWGAALMLYALLLLPIRTRPVGFAVGAVLYALFAISLLFTLNTAGPKNIVAIGGLVDCVVFHVFSIRTAWMQRLVT